MDIYKYKVLTKHLSYYTFNIKLSTFSKEHNLKVVMCFCFVPI